MRSSWPIIKKPRKLRCLRCRHVKSWSRVATSNKGGQSSSAGASGLDYDSGVSISYKMMVVEPRNMSTEHKLPRHVSRLKIWSKRRKMDSEIRTNKS